MLIFHFNKMLLNNFFDLVSVDLELTLKKSSDVASFSY